MIVIKPQVFRPEYRSATHQLQLCTGGFGACANSRGSAVFVKSLYNGKEDRFERSEVLGTIEPKNLPEWAKKAYSKMLDECQSVAEADEMEE